MSTADAVTRLREQYGRMCLIRALETEAERQYKKANIGGYCHLSSGQEVMTVGVIDALAPEDLLVTGYRCHGFAIARGVPAEAVMAELFGKATGCAHGRGGSMHLLDTGRGYYGGWGIVCGQLPVATGLALALTRQDKRQAVLCELGEGAANMGAWHEAPNLASLWDLPVVFLVDNNIYGMGTDVARASAEPEIYKRATAYRMHGERVDGDDLDAVHEAATRLLGTARRERRPAVLEAMTYRFRGHSVADAGFAYRSKEEVEDHTEHDPLLKIRARLQEGGVPDEDLEEIEEAARAEATEASEFAEASEEPDASQLAYGMYADGSDEQFSRMRLGAPVDEVALTFDAGLGR